MTFAVIKTGGKQYKVAANDVIKIEKIDGQPGDVVTFNQVLMAGEGDDVTVGAPLVEGAMVAGHFVEAGKERTVLIVKKHRRQHFDRRNGHRQRYSLVRIAEILMNGAGVTAQPDERLRARAAAKQQTVASVSSAPVSDNTDAGTDTAPAASAKPKRSRAAKPAETTESDEAAAKPARKTATRKSATKASDTTSEQE